MLVSLAVATLMQSQAIAKVFRDEALMMPARHLW